MIISTLIEAANRASLMCKNRAHSISHVMTFWNNAVQAADCPYFFITYSYTRKIRLMAHIDGLCAKLNEMHEERLRLAALVDELHAEAVEMDAAINDMVEERQHIDRCQYDDMAEVRRLGLLGWHFREKDWFSIARCIANRLWENGFLPSRKGMPA